MSLEYNYKLISRAKELRHNATKQEKRLWYDFLCNHQYRFQRQKVIDNYIADFYCAKAKLVIEIDGSQHFTSDGLEYDKIRTYVLQQYKLKVIRFTNTDIDNNFEGVCKKIDRVIVQPQDPLMRG